MKKLLIGLLLFIPALVFADTYTLSASWVDSTPTGPLYTPSYNLEYRINGGTATPISALTAPSYSTTITAAPTSSVEVRVQNKNTQGSLLSAWSGWILATAPAGPTLPSDPASVTLTVTRMGP
jgi:hypothetical protein